MWSSLALLTLQSVCELWFSLSVFLSVSLFTLLRSSIRIYIVRQFLQRIFLSLLISNSPHRFASMLCVLVPMKLCEDSDTMMLCEVFRVVVATGDLTVCDSHCPRDTF